MRQARWILFAGLALAACEGSNVPGGELPDEEPWCTTCALDGGVPVDGAGPPIDAPPSLSDLARAVDLSGAPRCGDGQCSGGESCSSCATDCGACMMDCRQASTWPSAWVQFEDEVLRLVNQNRAAGATCGTTAMPAVAALTMHAQLREAARCHSQEMAANNYFSHTGLGGSTPVTRMQRAGYTGARSYGENIAAGQATPSAVMASWMASPPHCLNIMRSSYSEIGVGYAYRAGSTYRHYWTQDFGLR